MEFLKEKIKKHYLKMIIIACDLLILLLGLICKYLSGYMLTFNSPCLFTLMGGKCISCGGTHFIKDLVSFRFLDAFIDNHFFFICALYLAVSLILLNLFLLFDLRFVRKALSVMYSIPALICFVASAFLFFFIRNIPLILTIIAKIQELT